MEVGKPTFVVAAGWDSVGESDDLGAWGLRVIGSAGRSEVLKGPLSIRRLVMRSGAESVVLTSSDWSRQTVPQLFMAALIFVGKPCLIHDQLKGTLTPVGRGKLAGAFFGLPFVSVWGLVRAYAFGRGLVRSDITAVRHTKGDPDSVLVIWLLRSEFQVGGGVTHISGILKGFKELGLRVGLVSLGAPPEQLTGLYDDLELVAPSSSSMRALPFTDLLAVNKEALVASEVLGRRLRPSFVYQRHAPYLRVGLDAADRLGVPLVLEFNGPAVWTRLNWGARVPGDSLFIPIAEQIERQSVAGASVCAAVSSNAADSAIEIGGSQTNILVSPNAVSTDVIKAVSPARPQPQPEDEIRIGWIGTFGPWHGAPVLVEALAKLPSNVTAVMVGHGAEWEQCREQAERLGVADRISLPGSLPHEEAIEQLSACDILASPHVPTGDQPFFGSPTKLFEFMALGLPIVASDLEQIGEVLEDGVTAVLCEPGDMEDFVAGLEKVIAMPDHGRSLGVAARAEAEKRHTWKARAREIVDSVSA